MDVGSLAPDQDEVEVSLFGPGYGESVVIHASPDCWIIIDSCQNPLTRRSAALEYLDCLGVSPKLVRLVVATHWHDDHIRGLGSILDSCPNAIFGCSTAINKREFKELISLSREMDSPVKSGLSEFYHVFEILKQRNAVPLYLIAGRLLLEWGKPGELQCRVQALSPSDIAFQAALEDIGNLFPREGQPKRRIPSPSPNHSSVVLWIEIGCLKILLGADLEETGDDRGWGGVLRSSTRPEGRASVFKIPHHGSVTAHNLDVWTEMLEARRYGILTPFAKGNTSLPTSGDCERICGLTDTAFITQPTLTIRSSSRLASTHLPNSFKVLHTFCRKPGHIRLRTSPYLESMPSWKVEILDGALALRDVDQ